MKSDYLPYLLKTIVLAVLYFGAAKVGLLFSFVEGNVTLVWPPAGIALAALLLFGSRLWPGVAVSTFLATTSTGAPLGFTLVSTIGTALAALAGTYLLRRVGFNNHLTRVRDVISLVFLGAGLSPMLSATIGVAGLCASGMAPWPAYFSIWWPWWLGDTMGVLIVAPALLAWAAQPNSLADWSAPQWLEAGAVLLAGLVTSLIVFGNWPAANRIHLAFSYLPFLVLLWAGLRFGPIGAATMNLIVNAVAVLGTVRGSGPFAQATLNESLFLLWAFMGIASVTALIVSASTAERQQTEAALRRSETRYRSVVEDMPDLLCRFQPGGILEFVNEAYARTFDRKPEELIGQSFLTLIPEESRAGVRASLEALSPESPLLTHEHPAIVAGGQVRWQRWTNRLLTDETGRTIAYQAFGLDITKRKQAEKELWESELRFRKLVEYSPDAMLIHQDWTIIFANEAMARLMGMDDPAVLVGKPAVSVVHPEKRPIVERRVGQLYAGQSLPLSEQIFIRQDGSLIDVEIAASPLMLEGKPAAFVIVRDITERKRAEEAHQKLEADLRQAQKMEAIGRLAGGIAHDFNNILVPIIGYTELGMKKLSPDDPIYSDLQRVREAAERAAGLTRQILAFSRKQVLEMRAIDLNALIMDFEKMIQRLIGENIEVQISAEPMLHWIKADKGQIEQVLLNLAVNAHDAMPQGGKLTIETDNVYLDEGYIKRYGEAQLPGHYVMLAVSDTGHGMDAGTQQHIFEPFFTTKEQGKGTGLGLATVFGIVKQHGGNIWVYSEPGRGTTFKIYLPQAIGMTLLPPGEMTSPVSVHGTETVLVVEDEEMVRKLVCETLAAHGYEVMEAPSPTEGLRQTAEYKETIHLLLTDVIMPEMNGQELYQKVAATHPEIKVLYMSGYTDEAIVHHHVLDKEVNFVQKPFTVQTLTQKVRQVLSD